MKTATTARKTVLAVTYEGQVEIVTYRFSSKYSTCIGAEPLDGFMDNGYWADGLDGPPPAKEAIDLAAVRAELEETQTQLQTAQAEIAELQA